VKHKRERWKAYEAVRPERDRAIYRSEAWRKVRLFVLGTEPLCRECRAAGRVTPATEVDHIRAVKEGGAPFDVENLQPLCLACHSRKTMQENIQAGKMARPRE
jgi:5-methylcytosine-specific restriction protein A